MVINSLSCYFTLFLNFLTLVVICQRFNLVSHRQLGRAAAPPERRAAHDASPWFGGTPAMPAPPARRPAALHSPRRAVQRSCATQEKKKGFWTWFGIGVWILDTGVSGRDQGRCTWCFECGLWPVCGLLGLGAAAPRVYSGDQRQNRTCWPRCKDLGPSCVSSESPAACGRGWRSRGARTQRSGHYRPHGARSRPKNPERRRLQRFLALHRCVRFFL